MAWYGMVRYSIEDTVRLVCFFANVIPIKDFCKRTRMLRLVQNYETNLVCLYTMAMK
jgi:hypothetical protein